MEKNNIPNIRFNKYSNDWKSLKLSEIADIIGGGTPSTLINEYWNGNIDWYSPTEIGESVYVNGSVKKITALGLENSSAKILPANKTILFTSRAGIGDMAILAKEGSTNQGFQSLVLKNGFHTYFIFSAQNQIKKYALSKASGSTFLEISSKVLGNMNLLVPDYDEQRAIGDFFEQIDNLIRQHTQKHENLLLLKNAMLDKMFPNSGKAVPEIRLKHYSGDWEKFELGKIGDPYSGLSGKSKNDFGHGDAKYVTYMNVFSNPISDINSLDHIESDSSQNIVKNGDVLFTISSETAGEVGMSSVWTGDLENVYLNSFCFGFRPRIKIDNYFLANILRTHAFRKKMTFLAQGISRYNISKNKVMNLSISLPNYEEQLSIGLYFKNLDILINQHNNQVNKLKNIKAALLSNLFIQ
ncbi:MAG: hypothetical protein RL624_1254 [Bacteroidota bacterium]|jgi:type I restriction enzyme S subunit